MNNFFKTYAKSLVAVVVAVLSAILAAGAGDGVVSANEWVNVAILGVGAASVFTAPNVPGARYTKAVLAALAAGLTALASVLLGGVTTAEWYQIGVAALGAVGVYAAPYKTTLNNRSVP